MDIFLPKGPDAPITTKLIAKMNLGDGMIAHPKGRVTGFNQMKAPYLKMAIVRKYMMVRGYLGVEKSDLSIKLINMPFERIISDIGPDFVEIIYIANDVVIEAALPKATVNWNPALVFDTFDIFIGSHCFKPLNNAGQ